MPTRSGRMYLLPALNPPIAAVQINHDPQKMCPNRDFSVGAKKTVSATQKGKSVPTTMRYRPEDRRTKKLRRRQETKLQQEADELWELSRVPYLGSTSQEILATETAKYHLFRLPSGIQLLEVGATTVRLLKSMDESFELLVTSGKTEWLRQSIDQDMVPTFLPEHRLFYYTSLTHYGSAYSWRIRFHTDKALCRFKSVLLENDLCSPDYDG